MKGVREGEWVVPLKSHMGTWQSLAIAKAADLVVIPKECMPAEYAALSEQLCLAFCLLEQFGKLKVGHCPALPPHGRRLPVWPPLCSHCGHWLVPAHPIWQLANLCLPSALFLCL